MSIKVGIRESPLENHPSGASMRRFKRVIAVAVFAAALSVVVPSVAEAAPMARGDWWTCAQR
jgi:hypothetical protein